MIQPYNFPNQQSLETESRAPTSELILAEISSLRNLITELYCLRQTDIEKIQQQAQEIHRLKYQLGRIQQDFNLQYFEPGTYKRFVFVQGSNPNFKLKGDYLSRSFKRSSNNMVFFMGKNQQSQYFSVRSGQAINNYIEYRFSIQVTVQNKLGKNFKLGLRTINQLLTKQMSNLPQKNITSYYQPKDKITMTVDKQKKMVFWFVNYKLIGKQELNIDWSQDIFPFLYLEDAGQGIVPQVII